MKLVVGLGNPGPEYAWSRHNAGWLAIDSCIVKLGLREPRMQFLGAFWRAEIIEGERVAWLKPHTYMNLSGSSVREACDYFDIEPSDVLVISDEVALPFGRLRYRDRGSAGGQKGLASVLGALGTLDVPRLRIGIGAPRPGVEMKEWVLSGLSKDQRAAWDKITDAAWEGVLRWVRGEAGRGFTIDCIETQEARSDV